MANTVAFFPCTDSADALVSGCFCDRNVFAYRICLCCLATLAIPTSRSSLCSVPVSHECIDCSGTDRYYSSRAKPFCPDLYGSQALELGFCVTSIGDTIKGLSGSLAGPVRNSSPTEHSGKVV